MLQINAAQTKQFYIKDFSSKCDHIHSFFAFCAVKYLIMSVCHSENLAGMH